MAATAAQLTRLPIPDIYRRAIESAAARPAREGSGRSDLQHGS